MLTPDFSEFPVLTTQRLVLRQMHSSDAATLMHFRSAPELNVYSIREPATSITVMEELINRMHESERNGEGVHWALELRDQPGVMIGDIGIWKILREHHRGVLGYVLRKEHQGKGLMSEALQAVIQYGFNEINLHSLMAEVNPQNIASFQLLERMGFRREGLFREDVYFRGEFHDTAVYSLLRSDMKSNF
jgi:[ribosomal protein S5]-alanine N-acetyltransferase